MKTCPKCGELNGDNRADCYKCRASLPVKEVYRKVCPKCGALYSPKKESCDDCGVRLSVYDPRSAPAHESGAEWWHYLVAILFPLIGVILGCVYISRGDDSLGKTVIVTALASVACGVFLGILLAACSGL